METVFTVAETEVLAFGSRKAPFVILNANGSEEREDEQSRHNKACHGDPTESSLSRLHPAKEI
jgi:hypothetical protein